MPQSAQPRPLDAGEAGDAALEAEVTASERWSTGADAAGRLVARHVQTWLDDTSTSARPTTATSLPVFLGCRARVRTDIGGAFWTIAADRMVDGRPWTITAERIASRDPSDRRRWSGRLTPPTEVRRGPNDLERAALEEEVPLVTGRIEGLPAVGRTPDL